jgi:hypothetical protein
MAIKTQDYLTTYDPKVFSELTTWIVDQAGAHIQLRKLQPDVYGDLMEPLQNAFDSNDKGEPNTIRIYTQQNPIIVQDEGKEGITKYHDGEINKFVSALKARSEKIKSGLKRKGIGMFAYTEIAPHIIVTSMDKEMIHQIPITEDSAECTCFGSITSKPASEKYKEEFKIYRAGTIVAFFNRSADTEEISPIKLRKQIKERWAYRMYENSKIKVISDGIEVVPPDYIVKHPPRLLFRLKGGHDVHGNIWQDPEGNGNIEGFQDGYKIETIVWQPRQCLGYFQCNDLNTTAGRLGFVRTGELWKDLTEKMLREIAKYPMITSDIKDEKQLEKTKDIIIKALGDTLKKTATAIGSKMANTKEVAAGNRDGTGETGYPEPGEPDPNREVTKRVFKGRDLTNTGEVSTDPNGKNKVRVASTKDKDKKKDANVLNYLEKPLGADRPLFVYFQQYEPPSMYANMSNAEYPYYKSIENNPKLFVQLVNILVAEIAADLNNPGLMPESTRFIVGKERIRIWKETKVYPLNASTVSSHKKNKSANFGNMDFDKISFPRIKWT